MVLSRVLEDKLASLYRAAFYVQSPDIVMVTAKNNTEINLNAVPTDRNWLLLVGDFANPFVIFQRPKPRDLFADHVGIAREWDGEFHTCLSSLSL